MRPPPDWPTGATTRGNLKKNHAPYIAGVYAPTYP